LGRGQRGKPLDEIEGERVGDGEHAERILRVFVDFGLVAREPVEFGARRLERAIEFAEQQPLHQRALAARAETPVLEGGDAFA